MAVPNLRFHDWWSRWFDTSTTHVLNGAQTVALCAGYAGSPPKLGWNMAHLYMDHNPEKLKEASPKICVSLNLKNGFCFIFRIFRWLGDFRQSKRWDKFQPHAMVWNRHLGKCGQACHSILRWEEDVEHDWNQQKNIDSLTIMNIIKTKNA